MSTDASTQPQLCPQCGFPIPFGSPQGLCPRCVLGRVIAPTEVPSAAEAVRAPSMERVAAGFPQLEVAELIGVGGMGAVFKARQRHLDRWVALKVLSESLAGNPAFVERFNREARVLARLNHPNIVTLYDFGQAGGFCYLLMEFVDGVNLRQALRAGRFTAAQALALVPKICEALQFAHDEGVLHRDVKPENILLDARGRVKIADFGIAKLLGSLREDVTLTASGASIGTPAYMAPEQIETPSSVDHRADIYSLGVVLYEMLTGELPLGRFPAPSARGGADARVDEIVLRALEKERERRQQSADEVRTQVEGVTGGGATAGPTGPSSPEPVASMSAAAEGASGSTATSAPSVVGGGRRWNRKAVTAALCTAVSLGLAALGVAILFLLQGPPHFGMIPAPAQVLVLGLALLGLFTALLALAGMGLGFASLREIRRRGLGESGRGLAWFSVATWPSLFLILMLTLLFAVGLKRQRAQRVVVVDRGVDGVELTVPMPGPVPDERPRRATPVPVVPLLPAPAPASAVTAADQERHRIRIELAEQKLAEMQARVGVGKATTLEVAQAERDLGVARAVAAGDLVAVARAKLVFAEFALADLRKKVEVGLEPPLALRTAEAEARLAKLDLEEALAKSAEGGLPTTRVPEAPVPGGSPKVGP